MQQSFRTNRFYLDADIYEYQQFFIPNSPNIFIDDQYISHPLFVDPEIRVENIQASVGGQDARHTNTGDKIQSSSGPTFKMYGQLYRYLSGILTKVDL